MYVVFYGVAKNFGRGLLFAIGLAFLGFIFFPILGFGNYQYDFDREWMRKDIKKLREKDPKAERWTRMVPRHKRDR